MVFKCVRNLAPACLIELIDVRDSVKCVLRLKHYESLHARKSFTYIAPKLWNNLPDHIRLCISLPKFKSQVKYLLFNDFSGYIKTVFKYN